MVKLTSIEKMALSLLSGAIQYECEDDGITPKRDKNGRHIAKRDKNGTYLPAECVKLRIRDNEEKILYRKDFLRYM